LTALRQKDPNTEGAVSIFETAFRELKPTKEMNEALTKLNNCLK
jgi:hypothetical protein